jgi:hypothetical protein
VNADCHGRGPEGFKTQMLYSQSTSLHLSSIAMPRFRLEIARIAKENPFRQLGWQ